MRNNIFLYISILVFSTSVLIAQNSQVNWSTLNMGYASSTTSNTAVKSVVGQSFVGSMKYSNNFIESGFLADTLFRSVMVGVQEEPSMPTHFELYQNYPNPFNPTTVISWQLPVSSWVTLKVYNLLGQEVATLVDEKREAGRYEVEFNASTLSSGFYFYRLIAGEYASTKKLILMK